MLEEVLRALEVFGKLLARRLFDDSWPCESDERLGFRDDDVAQRRKGCGDSPRRGVRQDDDERKPLLDRKSVV